jgi:hypothetical protein
MDVSSVNCPTVAGRKLGNITLILDHSVSPQAIPREKLKKKITSKIKIGTLSS